MCFSGGWAQSIRGTGSIPVIPCMNNEDLPETLGTGILGTFPVIHSRFVFFASALDVQMTITSNTVKIIGFITILFSLSLWIFFYRKLRM